MKPAVTVLSTLAVVCSVSGGAVTPAMSAPPVDVRGIYIVNNDEVYASPKGLAVQQAMRLPGVDGLTMVTTWSALEPAHGQYTWAHLDKWLGLADSLHLKITLSIKSGNGIPAWVFQAAPSGGGVAPLNFRVSPHEGTTGVCDTETIAAPWDANYLALWDTLLAAVSAHLKSAGTYQSLTALRLTGINRTSDELRLPAETAQSTGLSCVSDAVSLWQLTGYRPAKLLKAWDAITDSFLKSFPDKVFSVAIIPYPPQLPFPPLDASGATITGTVPDQNQPLLALAAQKFPGHLLVQFNFLMNNTPANWFVIQSAQTLGTMVGFQTNNYYSLSDSGAACGGTPANPVHCTPAPYLSQLETGIFPLGKDYGLRSQYIELWAINANAFPQDILQAHSEIVAAPIPADVVINLGAPQQLFHAGNPDAMGMTTVPDMHTTFIRQADSTYRVWITGHFYSDSVYGATGLITTRDFLKYKPVGNPAIAQVVLAPSCRPGSAACWNQYDADYAGADLVFPATNGKDLLMLYHGQSIYYGVRAPDEKNDPAWSVVGLARSSDNGVTWQRQGSVVSGSDVKPDTIPAGGIMGAVEPGGIVAGGYIYVFYAYFPTQGDSDSGPSTIQVARAPVSTDGAPGSWTKFYEGAFDSQPGLGGSGSQVVPTVFADSRPAQPWPVYSTYLNAYVLVFICEGGWYFSTSTDLVTWAPPKKFFSAPVKEFTVGQQTDENVVLVTPGFREQTIGQAGYVLYSHTPAWHNTPDELWMMPFAFDSPTTDVPGSGPALPHVVELLQNYPNPLNPSTTIRYELPSASHVSLTVFDVLGRQVRTLVNTFEQAGRHEAIFNAQDVSSGTYFYRLEAGGSVETRKLTVLR